jgi:hypothetical protein
VRSLWRRLTAEPTQEKGVGPARHGRIVLEPSSNLAVERARARKRQAFAGPGGPPAHHRQSDFRMELETKGARPIAKGLRLEILAFGKKGSSVWQVEPFAMPLVDSGRESARTDLMALFGRIDWMIANLDPPLRMRANAVAEMPGQHLRAQADAEEGFFFLQRNFDPIDFAPDPIVLVVCAHRAAEDHGADVAIEGLRQRVAKRRPADVEFVSVGAQKTTKSSRRRIILVQDDENPA